MRDVVVTRVESSGPPSRSRKLDERLMIRFPGAWRALAALAFRALNPRTRLRRAFLHRAVVSGWGAFNRRDYELMLVRYGPEVEFEFDPAFEAVGLGGTFHGHPGMLEVIHAFEDAWERMQLLPTIIVDLGDRLLLLGRLRLHGTASGVEFDSEFAQLLTTRGGLMVREQEFLGWEQGLRAAGLETDAIALPTRGEVGQTARSAR